MSEVRKWACEYCTYENYQASKKCVLCHATKPPTLINEVAENMNQDIYKIAPLVTAATTRSSTSASICCTSSSSTSSVVGGGSGIDLKAKWTCQACTYLNWPKSTKCVQCLTLRTNSSFSKSSQDHSLPLRIDVNIAGATARKPDKNSPRTSPKSPEATKELNNDRNRLMSAALKTSSSVLPGRINTSSVHSNLHASLRTCASAIKAPKWTCWTCTYENWARTVKCAMCGTIKAGKNIDGATASTSNTLSNRAYDLRIIDSSTASGRRIKRSPPVSPNNMERLVGGAAAPPVIYHDKNSSDECRLKQIRNKMQKKDWLWLNACVGVVEGDAHSLEAFISSGGDPGRQLNHEECTLLNRPSAFDVGFTLVHLAIRFQREDMLAVLLAATDIAAKGKKRVPSHITPDLAADILRDIASCLRQRKGDFPCYFLTEHATFALPADIVDLPRPVQKQLFDELLDCDVQHELEVEELVINWSLELTDHLGSRLYPLWNRTAGDCLLDSVLQATWGVFDRDNTLRRSLGDSLGEGATTFYPRWKEYESLQAQAMQFTLEDAQWVLDWDILLNLASQPGASLEQTHIFAIAHILRRPIIVYGVKYVKSFRGETIGYARFQGVYLPLLWEQSFCWKTPIALGYTRGHFSALVPMEIDLDANMGAGANIDSNNDPRVAYLPLTDSESKLLPIHFLTATELGREESLLREWLDCSITDGGTLVARMKFGQRPAMVRQMTDEWLDGYRRLSKVVQTAHTSPVFSSDGETDDE